jgi:hypothetical protein
MGHKSGHVSPFVDPREILLIELTDLDGSEDYSTKEDK